MKTVSTIILALTVSLGSISCAKNTSTDGSGPQSKQQAPDWRSWLQRYEEFMQEYLVLRRQLEAGESQAVLRARDFADKALALNREAGQIAFSLSAAEREKFEKELQKVQMRFQENTNPEP